VLADLEAKQAVKLSREDLQQLLPGARMGRMTARGDAQSWSNDADGTFVVSSDNRSMATGVASTARGKWHVSDDGRYCVLFEWRRNPDEEWCRFVFKTTDGYYSATSDKVGTQKVYKLEITGK
jgi:hypothetical protein